MPSLMNAFVSFSFLSFLASSPSSCQGDSVIWTTLRWHSSTHSSNSRCQWIDFACKSMYDYPIHKIPTAWGRSSIFWKSPRKKWRNTKTIRRIASIITNEKGQVARVFLNQIFSLKWDKWNEKIRSHLMSWPRPFFTSTWHCNTLWNMKFNVVCDPSPSSPSPRLSDPSSPSLL